MTRFIEPYASNVKILNITLCTKISELELSLIVHVLSVKMKSWIFLQKKKFYTILKQCYCFEPCLFITMGCRNSWWEETCLFLPVASSQHHGNPDEDVHCVHVNSHTPVIKTQETVSEKFSKTMKLTNLNIIAMNLFLLCSSADIDHFMRYSCFTENVEPIEAIIAIFY